jgi:uncharacterized alpha-E superfamily protein
MLSRVADSLYWMSRYIERAEHATRLLDVNLSLMLDESATSADRRWQRLLVELGSPKEVKWTDDPYELTQRLSFDTGLKGSILSCIISARENARHVREQISTEQWHRLNRLYLQVTRPEIRPDMDAEAAIDRADQPTEFLQQVMEGVHQFQGVSDSTMSHGEGWQFIQVGRYIERAAAIALLLEAYHEDLWQHSDRIPEGNEYLEWMGLLRSATAFEAYCKVYTADVTPDRIFEFLLLDQEFPHSVRFSIDTLERALEAIHGEGGKSRAEPLRRLVGRLHASLSYSSADEILNGDIVAYLRGIQFQCRGIHEMMYQLYIDYSIQAALAG